MSVKRHDSHTARREVKVESRVGGRVMINKSCRTHDLASKNYFNESAKLTPPVRQNKCLYVCSIHVSGKPRICRKLNIPCCCDLLLLSVQSFVLSRAHTLVGLSHKHHVVRVRKPSCFGSRNLFWWPKHNCRHYKVSLRKKKNNYKIWFCCYKHSRGCPNFLSRISAFCHHKHSWRRFQDSLKSSQWRARMLKHCENYESDQNEWRWWGCSAESPGYCQSKIGSNRTHTVVMKQMRCFEDWNQENFELDGCQ